MIHAKCDVRMMIPDTHLCQELTPAGIAIAAIDHAGDENPVDLAWGADRPAPPHEAVRLHPMQYAGETVQEKLAKVSFSRKFPTPALVAHYCCCASAIVRRAFVDFPQKYVQHPNPVASALMGTTFRFFVGVSTAVESGIAI